jgi:hypothetical protein
MRSLYIMGLSRALGDLQSRGQAQQPFQLRIPSLNSGSQARLGEHHAISLCTLPSEHTQRANRDAFRSARDVCGGPYSEVQSVSRVEAVHWQAVQFVADSAVSIKEQGSARRPCASFRR